MVWWATLWLGRRATTLVVWGRWQLVREASRKQANASNASNKQATICRCGVGGAVVCSATTTTTTAATNTTTTSVMTTTTATTLVVWGRRLVREASKKQANASKQAQACKSKQDASSKQATICRCGVGGAVMCSATTATTTTTAATNTTTTSVTTTTTATNTTTTLEVLAGRLAWRSTMPCVERARSCPIR